MTPVALAQSFISAFVCNGSRPVTLFADEPFDAMPPPERDAIVAAFATMLSAPGKTYAQTCDEIVGAR